ncbi:hypothetical protein ACKAV7_008161 [Fusarium commune]
MSSDPVEDPRKSEDYELISNGDVGSDTDQALDNGRKAMKKKQFLRIQRNLNRLQKIYPKSLNLCPNMSQGIIRMINLAKAKIPMTTALQMQKSPKTMKPRRRRQGMISQEVENDEVTDTTKEVELEWAKLLLDDDYDSETVIAKSPSQQEWSRQKREENQHNIYLDRIISMVGHEQIKAHFLAVKEKVDIAKRWNKSMKDWTFDLLIHGKNGTGKNMIAQLYAEFLHSIGVVGKTKFAVENKWYKDKITPEVSIVFFWDADRIDRESEVDDILEATKASDSRTKALDTSSESRRRFSNIIRLENYGESEIFELLTWLCKTKPEFGEGSATLLRTLSRKIAGRALAEGPAFTNAHAVAEEVDKVCERYQKRKEAAWMAWAKTHSPGDGEPVGPEHFKDGISLEDVLGIKPWTSRNDSTTWNQPQELVGLRQVKEDVDHIVDLAEVNYQHQLHGLKPLPISHNRCFLGAPGVGKTTVAALYAKILTELGLLSKGHVITKKASDLIGRYCGHSEGDTAQALEEAKGGVLIIDDAHLLYQERADGTNDWDDFRQGVIDTLVANVSGSPGEDRCVILCGYEDRMERMFLRTNSGLGRRFPLENAFRFTSYDDDELGRILKQKMESEDLVATDEAFKVARDMLSRMRRRPNFGNGGDVETLLNQANLRRIRRLKNSMSQFSTLTGQPLKPIDVDPDFDRSTRADENRNALFDDFVGFGHITDRFRKHQKMADGMRRYGIDPKPHIPWAFVFKGPPGTGKTYTTRKVDKLFYDMGFLSSDEVVICSVTNLIGQFSGHTGPKVIKQFELGLGKVLFIDEAYRLIGDSFHKEAIGELVDVMTKPRYAHNMVVILAGYSDEMEELLMVNPGLRSRIPQMAPEEYLKLLEKLLSKLNISLSTSTTGEHKAAVLDVLKQLIDSKGWASGRDVETLIQTIIELVFTKACEAEEIPGSEGLCVSCEELMDCLDAMLKDRGGALDDE